MYGAVSRIAALGCAAAMTMVALAPAAPMRERRVRTLLEESRAVYRLYYDENEAGTETTVRRLYDDNTIVYDSNVKSRMRGNTGMTEEGHLVLEDESRFPRSYQVTRIMEAGGNSFETRIEVEMFANVARRVQTAGGTTETRNFVLPTGTPLMSSNVVYPFYQLLFWYDQDRGGRQAFEVFEVSHRKTEKVVLERKEEQQTVSFGGQTVVTDLYVLEWPTHPERYFVDGEGRVIVAEFGFLRAELSEWVEGRGGVEGP